MSKSQPKAREILSAIDGEAWRHRIERLLVPLKAYWPADVAELVDANAGFVAEEILRRPADYGFRGVRRSKPGVFSIPEKDLHEIVRHAFQAGFIEAMKMHRPELLTAADAAVIVGGQHRGNKKGHVSQAMRASKKANEIREKWAAMEAAGENVTNDLVAAAVGCSRSTVIRAFKSKPSPAPRRPKR